LATAPLHHGEFAAVRLVPDKIDHPGKLEIGPPAGLLA